MVTFELDRWDFKVLERELVAQGLVPLVDFDFAWIDDDPQGWMIRFHNEQAALMWRLQHGDKWM